MLTLPSSAKHSSMDIFLLHFLLHFSSLFLPSASYILPENYFVNCGSSSSPSTNGRNYTGDQKPAGKFSLNARGSRPVPDPNSSDVEIYQTARIFRQPSSYEFPVSNNPPYFYAVRFHFYSSPAVGNLPDARFSVSASGFWLLSNFTVPGNSFPLVRDFFLLIQSEKLRIDFVPAGGGPYFAFVNAIEVFNTPLHFQNSSLGVIHRINVGGPNVRPIDDSLLRYWVPDDEYLVSKNAVNTAPYGVRLTYSLGFTEFHAPDLVYQTAKTTNISNITWSFHVKKKTDHLLRVHFCDLVTRTTTEQNWFRLYINRNIGHDIWPYLFNSLAQSPFYIDYTVHSDDSGFLNVTVGPNTTSPSSTAFLNGIEIMELVTEASSYGESESKRKNLFIIIGSVLGALILVAVVAFCFVFVMRKRRLAEDFDWVLAPFHSHTSIRTLSDSPLNLGLKFPLSEILYATKRFSPKLMIGQGGFGKVYKGTLSDGTKIAVKRSEPGHSQGICEFETEVMVLSKIRHQHLVSLMGYCDERNEMILVYEFMEKGTLREHLYISSGEESVSRAELSWEERLRICIGAAEGLNYLHTGSSGSTIIHRDIKSTNILLDGKLVAKVADFGISRSISLDETHMSTDVKGSFGYLDPEYFKCMQLTLKSDVYSFGVVLLEVLCARAVIDVSLPMEQVNLADWAMRWQRNGELGKIIDPFLEGRVHPESMRKFGETVDKCLQEEGSNRPNMVDVLWDLEYCLRLQGTAMPREPHEDSATDVSWGLNLPAIRRLPSNSVEFEDSYGFSGVSRDEVGEVFSQLKVDEAR